MGENIKECGECKSEVEEDEAITESINVFHKEELYFCCEGCREVYMIRREDDMTEEMEDFYDKGYNEGYQEGYDEGFEEGMSKGKDEGSIRSEAFLEGFKRGVRRSKICSRCGDKIAQTPHHIIPREYGGEDNPENISLLCFDCHDYVEEKTEELYKKGKRYSIDTLRSFIEGEFPDIVTSERKL